MPYCTLDDIKMRLPESYIGTLTDDTGGAAIDEGKVDELIADADATIDGYLRSRYAMPFDDPPRLIRKVAVDITVYGIYQRRYDAEMPEDIRARYKDAIKTLEGIEAGRINLPDIPVTESVIIDAVAINKQPTDRLFGRDVLNQW